MGGPRGKSNANLLASAAACTFKHLASPISCSNIYHLPLFFSLALVAIHVSSAPALLNLDYNKVITPAVKAVFHYQKVEERNLLGFSSITQGGGVGVGMGMGGGRRFLNGPGSWPPRCLSKCGRCKPCKAVHVPVPPGTPVTAEYYPEAWRCKCGNKLYMP